MNTTGGSYTKLSRESLISLLVGKDDELASLRTMNRETGIRLQEVERTLGLYAERFTATDANSTSLVERISCLETELSELRAKMEHLSEIKCQQERRSEQLEAELDHQLIWRRGYFPSLGLRVRQLDASNGVKFGGVEVLQCREPAVSNGIEEGDVLSGATVTLQRRIQGVSDYKKLMVDIAPDSIVSLEIARKGRKYVVQLSPEIVSHRSIDASS